jgi:catecholate siderophore receptor
MRHEVRRGRYAKSIYKAAFLSVSYVALAVAGGNSSSAQTSQQTPAAQPGTSQLPAVQIEEPARKPKRQRTQPSNRAGATAARRTTAPQPTPTSASSVWAASTYDARTGTVGIYTNSTSVATKVNTPLVNIPQSMSVLTKDFIRDQGFSSLTDVTRYVPGWLCIRAKEIATNSSFAAWIQTRTSSSTVSVMTFNTSAISTTRRASKFCEDRAH